MISHRRSLLVGFSLLSLVPATRAFSAESQAPSFEFHGYGRLGVSTNETLFDKGQDQGDGAFGLPTSRHIRDLNYLRIQLQGNTPQKSKFNLELQFDNLAHQTSNWSGAGANLRNAYFQMPVSSDTEAWVGARRLEFEDVRLFDTFPLSDTTFYGFGATTPLAGAPTTIAVGFKNIQNTALLIANDASNAAAGNTSTNTQRRDTSLFIRHDYALGENLAIRPTLILSRSGQFVRDGAPLKKYTSVNADNTTLSTNETPQALLTGKVGAVLSHWGDAGWGNHFVWAEQRRATGQPNATNTDTLVGLASAGDYEGWSAQNIGLMYSAMLQVTLFKDAQPKYSAQGDAFKPSGTSTSKNGTVLAVGVQPVYYVSPNLHVALDLNHTLTNKVGAELAKPNMTFVTPIVRYAANKTALATPQVFTSVTYGLYETKARLTSQGKASKTSLTTQTGCEFWF